MKKKTLRVAGVVVIIVLGLLLYRSFSIVFNTISAGGQSSPVIYDIKNATYMIDGTAVTLRDGVSEVAAAPGSASKIITRYFGNDAHQDFNGDGIPDAAFIVTQQTGGSGSFYYVVAALSTLGGYTGSDAVFLGDRIAPQTTEVHDGNIIVVNYADRKPGEPFTALPSEGKSVYLKLDPQTMKLNKVSAPVGSATDVPATIPDMSLGMKKWNWVNTTYASGPTVTPRDSSKFFLTFDSGEVAIGTDCNSGGGRYSIDGDKISFRQIVSTLMACEGSQEFDFDQEIYQIDSFYFTRTGELVFNLNKDGGVMTFK